MVILKFILYLFLMLATIGGILGYAYIRIYNNVKGSDIEEQAKQELEEAHLMLTEIEEPTREDIINWVKNKLKNIR